MNEMMKEYMNELKTHAFRMYLILNRIYLVLITKKPISLVIKLIVILKFVIISNLKYQIDIGSD